MKKLMSVLSVLVAIAMLVPMCAFAEPANAVLFTISDPVVSVDGEPMIDLTQLAIQVTAAANADNTRLQYAVEVFGGNENLAQVVAEIVDNANIYAQITGMTSVYTISSEFVKALFTQAVTSQMGDMSALNDVMSMLQNWTLPTRIDELANKYTENALDVENATVETLTLAGGDASVGFVPFAPDMNAYMDEFVALIDADPLVNQFLSMMALQEGMETMPSIADSYKSTISDVQLTGRIGSTETADYVTAEYKLIITTADDMKINADVIFSNDATGEGDAQFSTALAMYPDTEDASIDFALDGTYGLEGADFTLTGSMTEGEEVTSIIDATFSAGLESESVYSISFNVAVPDAGSVDVYGSHDMADGTISFGISAVNDFDETSSVGFAYTPDETKSENDLFAGYVSFVFSDGYESYDCTAHVSMTSTEMDTDSLAIDATNTIDISSMSEETMQMLNEELSTVLLNVLEGLERTVPGLEGITDAMFGAGDVDMTEPAEEPVEAN